MDAQLVVLCGLTFLIHFVATLAYAVRMAGVRTQRIAVSFALFNILVLVSRTSNAFLAPLLAKRVEHHLVQSVTSSLLGDFRWLFVSATVATAVAACLIPTFQRVFCRAVLDFQEHRSLPRLLLRAFSKGGIQYLKYSLKVPTPPSLALLKADQSVPIWLLVLNGLAVALWTVGVFAAIYAGYMIPQLRVTASSLSSVINGGATILLLLFIDPQLSVMTDEAVAGKLSEESYRRTIIGLAGSQLAGTVLAQIVFVPAAMLIAFVAGIL
jgi:hypothetical protein